MEYTDLARIQCYTPQMCLGFWGWYRFLFGLFKKRLFFVQISFCHNFLFRTSWKECPHGIPIYFSSTFTPDDQKNHTVSGKKDIGGCPSNPPWFSRYSWHPSNYWSLACLSCCNFFAANRMIFLVIGGKSSWEADRNPVWALLSTRSEQKVMTKWNLNKK